MKCPKELTHTVTLVTRDMELVDSIANDMETKRCSFYAFIFESEEYLVEKLTNNVRIYFNKDDNRNYVEYKPSGILYQIKIHEMKFWTEFTTTFNFYSFLAHTIAENDHIPNAAEIAKQLADWEKAQKDWGWMEVNIDE